MIADLLTKPLEGRKFHRFTKLLMQGLASCAVMMRILAEISTRHSDGFTRQECVAEYDQPTEDVSRNVLVQTTHTDHSEVLYKSHRK